MPVRNRSIGPFAVAVVVALMCTAMAEPSVAASVTRTNGVHARVKPHPGGLRKSPRAKGQVKPNVEQFTPTSHSVTKNGKTKVSYYAAPTFRHTSSGWERLTAKVTRHRGRFPVRVDGAAVPVWFGKRNSSMVRFRTSSGDVTWSVVGGRNRKPKVRRTHGRTIVKYRNVLPGVDVHYLVRPGEVKELVVLRSPRRRAVTFKIADRGHVLGKARRGKDEAYTFSGRLNGGLQVNLSAPMAWERDGGDMAIPGDRSAHQRVRRTRAGYRVRMKVDRTWLHDKSYPIVLDPTQVYSWGDSTLVSAFAPTDPTACSGNPCPFSSSVDGSAFIAMWLDDLGPVDALFHVDLGNIPATTNILHADLAFETGPMMNYYEGEPSSYPCIVPGTYDATATSAPVESWQDLDTNDWFDVEVQGPREVPGVWSFDVTGKVREWVHDSNADGGYFRTSSECPFARVAPQARGSEFDYLRDGAWLYDPVLSIDYAGVPLPPPLPVEQAYGCDCRWGHGANLGNRAADPVTTSMGSAFETEVDLTAPATGIAFAQRRTYNGRDDTTGVLGTGWSWEYEARLDEDPGTGNVTFHDPTGGQSVFEAKVGGGYEAPPAVTATLETVGGGGWKLTSLEGERLTFDADGYELADKDAAGRGVTLQYTASGSGKRVTSLTDAAGAEVTFGYGTTGAADGMLTSVTTDDERSVQYGYATVAGSPHLASITDPEGKITEIEYDATTGELDKITAPEGGESAQNVYDDGRLVEQTDALGNTWYFSWEPSEDEFAPPGSGTAETENPDGYVTRDIYYGHVLLKHIDEDDGETSYTYDNDLNLVAITDARGFVTTMTYDADGRMLTRTSPAPERFVEEWAYDVAGNVTSYTDRRGKVTTSTYNGDRQVTSITDPLGHTTTMTYNGAGLLASTETEGGAVTSYTYDVAGNQTSATSPTGAVTTNAYDAAGNLTSTTTPRGNEVGATSVDFTTTYTYDDMGRELTRTDSRGTVTTSTYDDEGRLTEAVVTDDADNELSTSSFTYDAAGHLLTQTDNGRLVLTRTYDEMGRVKTSTDALGGVTSSYYDGRGNLSLRIPPRAAAAGDESWMFETYFYYDQVGNLNRTSRYETGSRDTTYDGLGRVASRTDAWSNKTTFKYDANGNETSETDPLGRTTTWTYDDANRVTSEAKPGQDPTTYTYDVDNHRISATLPSGGSTFTWDYDADGRLIEQVDPRGNLTGADPEDFTTAFDYDADGNLTTVTDQLGHETSYAYDADGNQLSRTDANAHTTAWARDSLGRITEVNPPGASNSTHYAYDVHGDLVSVINGRGKTTEYEYDANHRLTSTTDPLGREETRAYDLAGNLTSWTTARGNAPGATAANFTVTQSFDSADRLVSRAVPGQTSPMTYQYDENSRLIKTVDASGATDLTYDEAGQLTEVDGPGGAYVYTYADDGQVASRTYPTGGAVTYTYDEDGAVASMTADGKTTTFDHDANQQLVTITYPTSVDMVETRTYDRAGRVSQIDARPTSATNPTTRFDYQRDPVGNPVVVERTSGTSTESTAYEYDNRDWLVAECLHVTTCTGATDSVAYSYDKNGNRTQEVRAGSVPRPGTIDYGHDDADQLVEIDDGTPFALSYDADGNLTSDGRVWNALGQLVQSNDGTTTTYAYDALGDRRAVTTSAGTRSLSWDINNPLPLLAKISGVGFDTTALRWGPDRLLIEASHPGAAYDRDYYTHDALGSITDSYSADGTQRQTLAYDAFGNRSATSLTTAVGPLFGYTGEPDAELGDEIALRARDYDPLLGRFTSTDPVAQNDATAAISTYLYVNNRPLVLTDPSGLCFGPDFICGGAKAVAGAATGVAKGVWGATTDHAGGCADRSLIECQRFFGDLVSLGGIENAYHNVVGCADRQLSGCAGLFLDVATVGVGVRCATVTKAGAAANAGARSLPELRAAADATIPSNLTRSQWGEMVWGAGGRGGAAATNARALIGRSADELAQIPGLNVRSATAWRDFYRQAVVDGRGVANPANATNQARVELLDDIISRLGG